MALGTSGDRSGEGNEKMGSEESAERSGKGKKKMESEESTDDNEKMESETATDRTEKMDSGSLVTGWLMLSIAIILFIISLSIYLYGLETVFSNKRFPDDSDTPCFLAFLVMGIIFLNLGIVYHDMALHPELFEEDDSERSVYMAKKKERERFKRRVKELEHEMSGDIFGGAKGKMGEEMTGETNRTMSGGIEDDMNSEKKEEMKFERNGEAGDGGEREKEEERNNETNGDMNGEGVHN